MLLDTIDLAMRWLTYPVAGAICANQIDELFIDASYVLRGLHRRERRVIPVQALRDVEQKRVAILLPAWKEADVIERMVEHNLAAIDYDPERVDVCLVEGAVATSDDAARARRIRERTRVVVALGDCAASGNVTAMRDRVGGAEAVR